jgi:hypothetical protein
MEEKEMGNTTQKEPSNGQVVGRNSIGGGGVEGGRIYCKGRGSNMGKIQGIIPLGH